MYGSAWCWPTISILAAGWARKTDAARGKCLAQRVHARISDCRRVNAAWAVVAIIEVALKPVEFGAVQQILHQPNTRCVYHDTVNGYRTLAFGNSALKRAFLLSCSQHSLAAGCKGGLENFSLAWVNRPFAEHAEGRAMVASVCKVLNR